MTDKELNAIRKRCEAATPGPWSYKPSVGQCNLMYKPERCANYKTHEECVKCEQWLIEKAAMIPEVFTVDMGGYDAFSDADAEFIAHAREDIPKLLELVISLIQDRDYWRVIRRQREES